MTAATDRGAARQRRALVYGDIDVRLIDGSSVWLVTMSELLASAGCDVTLLLKGPIDPDIPLLERVRASAGVHIVALHQPRGVRVSSGYRVASALAEMDRLDDSDRFDLVVVRGIVVAGRIAGGDRFEGRLWPYLTDFPQSVTHLDPAVASELAAIAAASRVVLCQTEEIRTYLESVEPTFVSRTAILPPAVPAPGSDVASGRAGREASRSVRLVYSGKLAPLWKTLEMTRLPTRLAEHGLEAELVVVGDKINADPNDPTYRDRMRSALVDTPGLIWQRGRSRDEAMRIVAGGDIGLSWRDERLDSSLELSTKVLEYGIVGLPVILNRTPMHERLLGRDYPLFATSEEDVVARVLDAVEDPSIRAAAAGRLLAAAEDHTFERSTERLRTILERAFPSPLRAGGSERKLRIAVASHDLKFFSAILQRLTATPDVEVRVDEWPALDRHDEERSRALAAWADVVICEWCGPNAIWYSRHKRRGQRLIVRLHRFELDRPWPARLAIENVDRVVAVSQSYATLMQRTLGWPADLIEVISNWVDDGSLDRPKLAGAQFHLGFIGMAPARKRLDRALDVLEWLRTADPRYRLFVKSKLSWEYPWLWVRPDERIHADLVMRRIQTSPLLRGSVVFDGFGPDVAGWLRGIGFILSTSEDESFHLAPAEGMAAGSVPAILDWPGAASIYDQHWIHASTSAIGEYIASTVSGGRWDAERELARAQSREHFGLDRILDEWAHMILDVLGSPARTAVPSHR